MEERWFQVALELTPPLRHLVIRTGSLSVNYLPESGAERMDALAAALGEPFGLWSSFDATSFEQLIGKRKPLAMVVSGLTRQEAVGIHRSLRQRMPGYLGMVEIDNRIPQQWALFDQLPLRYRLVGGDLRVLWSEALSDDPPIGMSTDWKSR